MITNCHYALNVKKELSASVHGSVGRIVPHTGFSVLRGCSPEWKTAGMAKRKVYKTTTVASAKDAASAARATRAAKKKALSKTPPPKLSK